MPRENQLVSDLEELTRQLSLAADRDLDHKVSIDTDDPAVAGLVRQINHVLALGHRALSTDSADRKRLLIELESAKEGAALAGRIKSEFLATISDELRTPLTLIAAPIEELLSGDSGHLSPTIVDALSRMSRNAARLTTLVDDLLDLRKLGEGKTEVVLQPVHVDDLVFSLVEDAQDAASAKRIDLCFSAPDGDVGAVPLDRRMFEKIVLCLVGNALKFTPAGGRVDVTLRAWREGFQLEVADTGIGIPKDKQHLLFQRFQQLDASPTRKYEGAGLGLALVKELTEKLRGEVSVESEQGKGTLFVVRLPRGVASHGAHAYGRADTDADADALTEAGTEAGTGAGTGAGAEAEAEAEAGAGAGTGAGAGAEAEAEALTETSSRARTSTRPAQNDDAERAGAGVVRRLTFAPTPSTPSPPLSSSTSGVRPSAFASDRPRVLIAEENPDMRAFVAELLSDEYNVIAVENGAKALEMALTDPPEVIVTDTMMPGLDGFELTARLKEDASVRQIPVILMTANTAPDEAAREEAAGELGADDYLRKPFSPADLRSRVRAAERLHRVYKELALTLDELFEARNELVRLEEASLASRLAIPLATEIRVSLASVRAALEAISNSEGDERDDIADVLDQVVMLEGLIADFEEIAEPLDANEPPRTSLVDAAVALADSMTEAETEGAEPAVIVRASMDPPATLASERDLRMVLENIVTYARERSKEPAGTLVLEVDRSSGRPHIGVRAPRLTLPESVRRRALDVGKDIDSSRGRGGVLDLRLALATQILRRNGGELRIEEDRGGGAVFHIYLPEAP